MQLEKEKDRWILEKRRGSTGVTRGYWSGGTREYLLVEDETKGGCVGTSTSLLKNGRPGGDDPVDHYR